MGWRHFRKFGLAGALMVVFGCGGGGGSSPTPTPPPAPTITSFLSSPGTITTGGTATLTGVFSNGAGVISPGNLPATSGVAVNVSPAATTAYTLTVTNSAGVTVNQVTTITAVPQSTITSFVSDFVTVLGPGNIHLTATFTDGAGIITPGNIQVTSGTPVAITGIAASTTYTLTVTNSVGSVTTKSLDVKVGVTSVFAGINGIPGNNNGQGTAASFNSPNGMAIDTAGNVYVADYGNGSLRKITSTGLVSTLATGMPFINSVAVNGSGNIFVTLASTSASVVEFSATGSILRTAIGSPNGGVYLPWGVAVDSNGNIYIANYENNAITKITPSGVQSYINDGMDSSPAVAVLMYPTCIAVDGSGNLYCGIATTLGSGYIYKVTPAGNGSFLANGVFAGNPTSIAVDGAGNLYVVAQPSPTSGGYPFALISPSGVVTPWTVSQPTAVAVDSQTGNVFVSSNHTVLKIHF